MTREKYFRSVNDKRSNYRYKFISLLFLAIPVCFFLTSNRRQETYEAVFRCLKRLAYKKNIDWKPTAVVCDFERAFMNAVQAEVCDFERAFMNAVQAEVCDFERAFMNAVQAEVCDFERAFMNAVQAEVCDFERAFMNAVQAEVCDFFLISYMTFNNIIPLYLRILFICYEHYRMLLSHVPGLT